MRNRVTSDISMKKGREFSEDFCKRAEVTVQYEQRRREMRPLKF